MFVLLTPRNDQKVTVFFHTLGHHEPGSAVVTQHQRRARKACWITKSHCALLLMTAGASSPACFANPTPIYRLPVITNQLANNNNGISYLGSTISVNAQPYRTMGINSVNGLLHSALGLQVKYGNAPNPQIYLRGKPTLVLLNGIPISNFSMQPDDLNLIPFASVKKVVVMPAVNGARYGNQTTGGAINIITQQPGTSPNTITITGGFPWQSHLAVHLNHTWQNGWFASSTISGDYDNGYRNHNETNQQDVHLTLGKHYDNGTITGSIWSARNDVNYPGALTDNQLNKPTYSDSSRQSRFKTWTSGGSLNWQQQFNHHWQLQVNSLYRHQDGKAYFPGFSFYQGYDTVELQPTVIGQWQGLGRTVHSQFGTDIVYDSYDDTYTPKNAHRNQYAVFYQMTVPIAGKLSLTSSYRFAYVRTKTDQANLNQQSNHDDLHDVSLQLHYQFNPHWHGYIERLEGYQLPFIDQQTYTSNGQIIDSFALVPTTSTTYQMGITAHYSQVDGSIALYQINDKNEVGYTCVSDSVCANVNLPKTRARGITAMENWHITPTVAWQNTLDAQKHVFTTSGSNAVRNGNTVPGAALITWASMLRYHFLPEWTWRLSSQYDNAYFADSDFGNQDRKVPSSIILNTALSYHHQSWLATLTVNDIADTTYFADASYVAPAVYYYPANGREILLTVQYAFGA